MTCSHCGTRNLAEEDRCSRCGRRLHVARAVAADTVGRSSLAVAVQPKATVLEPPSRSTGALQPELFPHGDAPRVIPISQSVSFGSTKPAVATPAKPRAPRKVEPRPSAQQSLGFVSSGRTAPQRQEAVVVSEIYCDAPVASTQHRTIAAAMDGGILLAAFGIVISVFFWAGHGEFPRNLWTVISLALILLLVTLAYQALWIFGNGDSAGLRWARLHLVNFDGRRPNRRERAVRMAASWLSVLPCGLGLFWALMDEENLTWHDQISKTFPSPVDARR